MVKNTGFTLIELLIVMAIIGLLASIAYPSYYHSLDTAKRVVLRQNLATMRDAMDHFYADHGMYPSALADLVTAGYLTHVPTDPITNSPHTWQVGGRTPEETTVVYTVHSGAAGQSPEGIAYKDY